MKKFLPYVPVVLFAALVVAVLLGVARVKYPVDNFLQSFTTPRESLSLVRLQIIPTPKEFPAHDSKLVFSLTLAPQGLGLWSIVAALLIVLLAVWIFKKKSGGGQKAGGGGGGH